MSKRDYYEILGVNRDCDEDDIKKAYRKLAMKHHPDRNPDNPKAEEHFKEAKEAYEILSVTQTRAAYDQYGHAGVDSAGGGAHGFGDAFSDIFSDLFNSRGHANVHRGADLRYNLEITLEQAARGTETKIRIPRMEVCDLPWQWRKAGNVARHLPHLQWTRASSHAAGIFLDPADLSQVSRQW